MPQNAGHPVVEGIFEAVAPVIAAGNTAPIRIDSDAILLTRSAGSTSATRYSSAGDAASGLVVAGAAVLYELYVNNNNAALRYLQLFNAVALPANGTIPFWTAFTVPGASDFGIDFPEGLPFTTGLFWAGSTTRATLTVVAATDFNVSMLRR